MNINQEGYTRRLDRVRRILGQYALAATTVTPLAYVEHCPFYFNNYIYKVELAAPALPASFTSRQPCTTAVPDDGTLTLIVRLSNPLAEGLNNTNRVQNEVAALYLTRQSLEKADLGPIVPAVYAWAPCTYDKTPTEDGFAWIMMEFKQGTDLNEIFPSLNSADRQSVIEQYADLLMAVQRVVLPESAPNFGGLSIEEGRIVSGQLPLAHDGPFASYTDAWVGRLRAELKNADGSPLIQGWKPAGVRDRLDAFLECGGVGKILIGVDVSHRTLVHYDFTMNNMLYDPQTKKITALLDFDFSRISHTSDEFFTGVWDVFGGVSDRNSADVQAAVLSGNFDEDKKPPADDEEASKQWEVASAWNDAITKRGLAQPSNIAEFDRVMALKELEDLLSPFQLQNEAMVKRIGPEAAAKQRQETETSISAWLDKWHTHKA